MNKRSKNCKDGIGRWDCGGDAMGHGETFEQAVRREVKEEYCCDMQELTFVTANNVIREHNGKKTHWITLLFTAKVDPSQVK